MRAAPAVEVVVWRFGVWRSGLLALGSAGVSAPWVWLLLRIASPGPWPWCVAAAASMLSAAAVSRVWRASRPFAMHWDSQNWSVAVCAHDVGSSVRAHRSLDTVVEAPALERRLTFERSVQGEMSVVVDFGSWMLLRFDTSAIPPDSRAANATNDVNLQTSYPTNRDMTRRLWLPLQSAGLEPRWHALRCALYSPVRPDADAGRRSVNTRQSA